MQADTWIHDFGKFKMVLSKADLDISAEVKKFGWYEDENFDSEIFETHLKKGMTVLDLGANIGFYSLLARSVVGEQGRIFSFEPFPGNIALLRESIKHNGFTNIVAIESAVSDKPGTSTLHLSPDYCSEHSLVDLGFEYAETSIEKSVRVPVTSVDDYFTKNHPDLKIDFIKMDIEGSESKALQGMQETLKKNRKISIMTEFWTNGFRAGKHSPEDFLENLVGLGFDLYNIDGYGRKLQQLTPNEIMNLEKASQGIIAQDEYLQEVGWYTNLLCVRV
ncbi:MAG: FkbM family methyltransferase [Candidatus Nitrosotenuis sp.]